MEMGKLILSALIALVLAVPFHLLMAKLGLGKSKGDRMKQEAKKAGRMVTGHLTRSTRSAYMPDEPDYEKRRSLWHVTYTYTVNGTEYRYRAGIDARETPPGEIRLFYPKGHPEKAIAEGEQRHDGRDLSLVLLPVILWAVIYHLIS